MTTLLILGLVVLVIGVVLTIVRTDRAVMKAKENNPNPLTEASRDGKVD